MAVLKHVHAGSSPQHQGERNRPAPEGGRDLGVPFERQDRDGSGHV